MWVSQPSNLTQCNLIHRAAPSRAAPPAPPPPRRPRRAAAAAPLPPPPIRPPHGSSRRCPRAVGFCPLAGALRSVAAWRRPRQAAAAASLAPHPPLRSTVWVRAGMMGERGGRLCATTALAVGGLRRSPGRRLWPSRPTRRPCAPRGHAEWRAAAYSHYSVISVPFISTVDINGTTEAPQSPRDRGM